MKKLAKKFLQIIFMFSFSSFFGQTGVCDNVLTTKTIEVLKSETRSKLAWLNLVNEKNYEQKKEEGKAIVPGYFSGNYSSFSEKRNEIFHEENYLSEEYESREELRISLPTSAYKSWSECIQLNSKGLFVYIQDIDSKGATILLCWKPPVGLGGKSLDITSVELTGSTPSNLNSIKTINEGDSSFILQRNQENGIIRGVINAKINTGSYTIKIYIPDMTNKISQNPIEICSCVGHGGVEGVTFWGPKGEPCNGIPNWGNYSQDCRKVEKLFKCQGKGGVAGVTLWGPENCDCAGIKTWGQYNGIPVKVSLTKFQDLQQLCGCKGNGNILNEMVLWGPSEEFCGGIQTWGKYNSYCK